MSDESVTLPALEHGFVKGRFVRAVADSLDDDDRYPDLRAMEGAVRIVSDHVIHLTEGDEPATVEPDVIMAEVDERGYMVDVTSKDDPEREPGMWLAIGRYTVELAFAGSRKRRSFGIEVKPEHTKADPLHLTLAEPQMVVPQTTEITRIIDRQLAQLAAEEAKGYADTLEEKINQVVNEGFTLATESTPGLMPAPDRASLSGATNLATPETLVRRNSIGAISTAAPEHHNHAANKSYVDGRTQLATTSEPGVMSTADKTRLNSAVTADNISRIIVSENAESPLSSGELLVVPQSDNYFTDFSTESVGNVDTDRWEPQWVATDWEIAADTAATGGRVLRRPSVSTSSARWGIKWVDVDQVSAGNPVQELLVKWKAASAGNQHRMVLYGNGSQGSETGYAYGRANGNANHVRGIYIDGSLYPLNSDNNSFPDIANRWWISRFRVDPENNIVAGRSWLHGNPEPSVWDISTTLSSNLTEPGWVGLMPFSTEQIDYDWVAAAFGGGRAHKP